MSSSVIAPPAPNGDNGNHQGHCSKCHKVWTLKERQGVCQWCNKPSSCQTTTTQPRHIKSSRRRKQRQADHNGNGYDQLTEPYLTYYKVASRFNHKAKPEDTEDLLHTIILTLAVAEQNNGHTRTGRYTGCYPAGYYIHANIGQIAVFTHHWTNIGMTTWM